MTHNIISKINKTQLSKLTLQCMDSSIHVFVSHSSMFASIVEFGPMCSQISGRIEAQQIYICLIFLAQHSICPAPNTMNYKLNVIIIISNT